MGLTRAFDPVGGAPADDGDDWMPDDDAWAAELGQAPAAPPAPELDDADEAPRGRHGRHGRVPDEAPGKGRKGRKKDAGDEIPAYLRKSRRMRRILIAVAVILVLLLAAGAYFTWQLVQVAETSASQQAQAHQDQQQAAVLSPDEANDASSATTVKKTTVPNLTALLGLDQDQAIEYLAHGAQVASTREVNEEDNPVRQEVRVALTEEPADARTGTPTVYLGLGEDGLIVQVGYSTSTASLGYGSLSFADAVRNESIIEKTLAEAGVDVDEGSVALPEDKESYSTYDTDGKTLIKEYCSFYGEADVEGTPMQWSAVLSYDYTMANATSNLADTVRTIYVYVGA
ncbi:MAG: histone-lysine N-methyltransferase [Eggerthellaceae bacterium]|nr:histone-lysine N-methyltransferase [Eggerthellaceae bacterium]